jgi:WD40-like Beta Propeller Repeat
MPRMKRLALVAAAATVTVAALASTARATFSGENGRIFYVVASFTPYSAVVSACPGGTHVQPVISGATFPSPSPDGTKIAYNKIDGVGSNAGVWIANADGSDPEQITDATYSDYYPTWSPDGTKLTFHRYVSYPAPYYSVVQPVVADVETKVVTPLLSDGQLAMPNQATWNAWSPDGSTIYFQGSTDGGNSSGIYQVSAGGGAATRILGTDSQFPYYLALDLAPDGETFMVEKQIGDAELNRESWRYDKGGTNGIKLADGIPNAGTSGDELLAYSPDGTKILFDRLSVTGVSTYHYTLFTADLDGSNAEPLGGLEGALARWSTNVDDCTDPGASTMKINEVALGSARYVELLDPADETFPSEQGPYEVVVYDGGGVRQGAHTISSALLQGRDNTTPLLLSTAAADAAYGVSGDELLSVELPSPGQACFTKGTGESKLDCVSWGCITSPVTAGSTRIPPPPSGSSAQRQGIGSTIFQVAIPTPKAANVAGSLVDACVEGPTTTLPSITTTTISTPTTTTTTTLPACTTASCILDAALHEGACGGVSIPAPIAHKVERALGAIDSAAMQTKAKKARAARRRARHLLAAAGRKAKHSARGKHPKLPAECAAAIQAATGEAAGALP